LRNMEALGLYCYLHSLPNNWEFHKNHLKNHANIGINKLNTLLKILEKHALIKTVQIRTPQGRFAHFDLEVDDGSSFIINPLDESCAPFNENRDTVNRATDNSTYKRNKIENKESKKEISKNNSASDDAPTSQECSFDEFWNGYPIKKNKVRAKRIWDKKKLNKIGILICEDISNRQSNDSSWADEQFIPHPSTYLQNELWNDEITKKSFKKFEHPVTASIREFKQIYQSRECKALLN